MLLLVLEEPHLPRQSATISYEFARCSDDSVTGDDDDDPIVVIGSTDSSYSPIPADHLCLFSVAACLTVWDLSESLPGVSLELGSIDCERYIEYLSSSGEVFSELEDDLFEENIYF